MRVLLEKVVLVEDSKLHEPIVRPRAPELGIAACARDNVLDQRSDRGLRDMRRVFSQRLPEFRRLALAPGSPSRCSAVPSTRSSPRGSLRLTLLATGVSGDRGLARPEEVATRGCAEVADQVNDDLADLLDCQFTSREHTLEL